MGLPPLQNRFRYGGNQFLILLILENTKLDILAFAAHPDDTELSCSGTLAKHIKDGYKIGVVDLTMGELGTRGNAQLRLEEATASSEYLGLAVRDNLGMEDGFFEDNKENQISIVQKIRQYKPEIVLANAVNDRHPDHGRGAAIVKNAFFLAGLSKIKTQYNDQGQEPWRPKVLYHYIQSWYIQPDFVVDVTESWEKKIGSIKKFKSQFFDPDTNKPDTYISSKGYLEAIEARAIDFGLSIGVKYAEGFTANKFIGVSNLFDLK